MNCSNCSQLLTSADQPCPYCGAAPAGGPSWPPVAPPPAEWAQWAPPGTYAAPPLSADGSAQTSSGYLAEPDAMQPPTKRGGRGRLIGALAIALIPLLIVGIVIQRANRGSAVGSATAQGAVTDLAAAVGKQDVLGALAAIAPEESAAATNIVKAVIDKAQQNKLISDPGKPLAGVTASVDGLRLSVHTLHPLVARVDVRSGTLSYSFDPSRLAGTLRNDLGDSVKPASGTVSAGQGQRAVDTFNQNSAHKLTGVYIMTVKRNGRWFVSPFYTVAEYLREAGGLPAADYDATTHGQLTGGASSPELVVRNLFAGSMSDPAKSLTALPPDSLRVIYDYMGDIKSTVDNFTKVAGEGSNGPKVVVRVDNLSVSTQPAGVNGAKVNLDSLTAVATISGSNLVDPFANGCGSSDLSGGSPVFGSSSGSSSGSSTTAPDSAGLTPCPPVSAPAARVPYSTKVTLTLTGTCYSVTTDGTTGAAPSDSHTSKGCLAQAAPGLKLDQFFVMAIKERGAWYVDPLGTVAAYLKVVVQQATPADVECLLRQSSDHGRQRPATQRACAKSTMLSHG